MRRLSVAWKRIVNASPIVFLTRLDLLDILGEPGVDVLVPDAVSDELARLSQDDPAAAAVRSTAWIEVVPTPAIPDFLRAWKLDAGARASLPVNAKAVHDSSAAAPLKLSGTGVPARERKGRPRQFSRGPIEAQWHGRPCP